MVTALSFTHWLCLQASDHVFLVRLRALSCLLSLCFSSFSSINVDTKSEVKTKPPEVLNTFIP